MLTERLKWLADNDILARREYSSHPPRFEYVLTAKGLELCELLMVMVRWGDRWTAGEAGPPVLYRHRGCGQISQVDLHCTRCQAADARGRHRYSARSWGRASWV